MTTTQTRTHCDCLKLSPSQGKVRSTCLHFAIGVALMVAGCSDDAPGAEIAEADSADSQENDDKTTGGDSTSSENDDKTTGGDSTSSAADECLLTDGGEPETSDDSELTETLAEMNAGFKNIELGLLEWPSELHENLGELKKVALVARPVEKIAGKLPLMINLHGGGPRWWEMSLQEQLAFSVEGKLMRGFDLAELAGKGLIELEPNSAGHWDAETLDTMLDYVLENCPEIDGDRVYVIGYSMGGKGTWDWINESAERFAAASPSGFSGGAQGGDLEKLAKLPIWGMAGGDDGNNTTGMRRMVERLEAAGNVNVKYTEFEGADHNAGNAGMFSSVELVDWMLGFKRP